MKITKTNELTAAALDWAVANCEGYKISKMHAFDGERACMGVIGHGYSPSTDWAQGGQIIEREGFDRITKNVSSGYTASKKKIEQGIDDEFITKWVHGSGPTPLIASMRCYVASKLGDTVNVPEELL